MAVETFAASSTPDDPSFVVQTQLVEWVGGVVPSWAGGEGFLLAPGQELADGLEFASAGNFFEEGETAAAGLYRYGVHSTVGASTPDMTLPAGVTSTPVEDPVHTYESPEVDPNDRTRYDIYSVTWVGGSLDLTVTEQSLGGGSKFAYLSNGPSTTYAEFMAADVLLSAGDAPTVISAGDYDLQVELNPLDSEEPPPESGWITPVLPAGMTFAGGGPDPAVVAATRRKLMKVGMNHRQAVAISDLDTATLDQLIHVSGYSPRQAKTLLRTPRTMKSLLRGGFTRHQAKLILGL